YRTASTKVGRRYARLAEGDRVVLVALVKDEGSVMLASRTGRVIHFAVDEVNILAGAGKGVLGIKLADGDACLGGAVLLSGKDRLTVERSDGETMDFTGRYDRVSRGGKGFEAVKRRSFARVLPAPIVLADWEAVEGREEKEK